MKVKVYWTMSFHIIWTMFGYHLTNLKIFISKNEVFQQICDKCVVNWKLTRNHIHIKMTSIVKWAIFLISLKLIILITNETLKLVQSKQDCGVQTTYRLSQCGYFAFRFIVLFGVLFPKKHIFLKRNFQMKCFETFYILYL
jgi:hypothetical protein